MSLSIQATYTKTYKSDLQNLIKILHADVRNGNMSSYTLMQDAKSELISLSHYDSRSFNRLPKSKRTKILNDKKEKWQPKVTMIEKQTAFTALKYRK